MHSANLSGRQGLSGCPSGKSALSWQKAAVSQIARRPSMCSPRRFQPAEPAESSWRCHALKYAHYPLFAARSGMYAEPATLVEPVVKSWGLPTFETGSDTTWIYHIQAVAESVGMEEEDGAEQWHNTPLVVAGSAAERSEIKPDMQDRHVKVPNVTMLAAQQLVAGAEQLGWQSPSLQAAEAEDLAASLQDLQGSLTAVFDGHGGSRTVRYAARALPEALIKNRALWQAMDASWRPVMEDSDVHQVSRALCTSFSEVDQTILAQSEYLSPGEIDGTTALVGLQVGQHLFVANVGDSRAVLSRGGVAVRMTQDHTPDVPEERRRIEAVGGIVRQHKGVWRLCLQSMSRYVLKISSVSRALGDVDYKRPTPLMSAVPDVFYWALHPRYDRFAIYATDGVWGVMHDQQAVDEVERVLMAGQAQGLSTDSCAQLAAATLVERAKELGSYDDITAVVTLFNWRTV